MMKLLLTLFALAVSSQTLAQKVTCANVRCKAGTKCVEPAKCVPIGQPLTCRTIDCLPEYVCVPPGKCVPRPATCASTSCPVNSRCVELESGAKCELTRPPLTCATINCRSGYVCVPPGKCVPTCAVIDCKPPSTCVNGKCIQGTGCETVKCSSGYVCVAGKCEKIFTTPLLTTQASV